MVSYVVDIALSVTHLGKVIRGHFDLVLGILNFAFKYGPDRIEQKQLMDNGGGLICTEKRAVESSHTVGLKERERRTILRHRKEIK